MVSQKNEKCRKNRDGQSSLIELFKENALIFHFQVVIEEKIHEYQCQHLKLLIIETGTHIIHPVSEGCVIVERKGGEELKQTMEEIGLFFKDMIEVSKVNSPHRYIAVG